MVLLCDCQEARLLVFSPAFAARQLAAMPLEPTGIRVLAPRRVRQDGTSEMVVEICEPAESPGWIFQVVLDLDLVQPEHEKLPLLPEARALMLFLQSGVPWALADSGHHERSCAWSYMVGDAASAGQAGARRFLLLELSPALSARRRVWPCSICRLYGP